MVGQLAIAGRRTHVLLPIAGAGGTTELRWLRRARESVGRSDSNATIAEYLVRTVAEAEIERCHSFMTWAKPDEPTE